MVRSMIKPETMHLWQVLSSETGLALDVSVRWDEKEITVSDGMAGAHQEWEYSEVRLTIPYQGDSARAEEYLAAFEPTLLLLAKTMWEKEHGEITLTKEEREQLIDRETDVAITSALHPAGRGEHFAALREQIAQMLADSGQQPIKKFQNLQDIAGAEIAKGQKKKDVLKE